MAEYPPFATLARILIAHKDENKASKITLDTVSKLKVFKEVEIVGHGKAPVRTHSRQIPFSYFTKIQEPCAFTESLAQCGL